MEDNKQPFPKINWIASYPKSGNTWIRCLLYAYEFSNCNINQMIGFSVSDISPGYWFIAAPLAWGMLDRSMALLLRYNALFNIIATSKHLPIFVKTHCANFRINSVDLIPFELTEAATYIIRDPRDVVVSYSKHMGMDIDKSIEELNNGYLCLDSDYDNLVQPMGSWSHNVESWTAETKYRKEIIRYEDLLNNTEKELRKVIKLFYQNEEIDEERLKLAVELTKFEELKKQEEKIGFKEATKNSKFFTNGTSGNWKNVLTKEQIYKIEEDHHEMMQRAGYELYS